MDTPIPTSAADLRRQGNELFKAQQFTEAANCYRRALSAEPGELAQTIRLNLSTCLLRLGTSLDEVLALCDDFLSLDGTSAKAFYLRGSARFALAEQAAAPDAQRDILLAAKKDLVQAAKASPGDKQVRARLDEVAEVLRTLPSKPGILAKGSLYDDRQPEPPKPPPVICSECGRYGHPKCGLGFWLDTRAAWLGVARQEVEALPADFEDDGPLGIARHEARCRARALEGKDGSSSSMSADECDILEDCLESTQRPYPLLKRQAPLTQVVRFARELWDDN